MTRLALITGDADRIKAYLPSNYYLSARRGHAAIGGPGQVLIEGNDSQGWTLEGYVLPRLASGLLFGYEVNLTGDRIYRCTCCGNADRMSTADTEGLCQWCEDDHHANTVACSG